ncbi:TPA: ead/Ea22-like family protein [Escherichia coli]
MSKINYQALREKAERAIPAMERLLMLPVDDDLLSEQELKDYGVDIDALNAFKFLAGPETVLALLDELEAKDSSISTQQHEIRTLLNALEQATEKRNSDIPGQKRLIGWRASDYTDETSDPELAKNWAAAIGVLPIFEGDVNTKLSAAGIKVE